MDTSIKSITRPSVNKFKKPKLKPTKSKFRTLRRKVASSVRSKKKRSTRKKQIKSSIVNKKKFKTYVRKYF